MKFVWHGGRCYEQIRETNSDGKILLVDLRDHSRGHYADPKDIRECSKEDVEGIEYFLEMASRGQRHESQAKEV